MIKRSPPKGWERLKAKVPFDPKGKQELVHNNIARIANLDIFYPKTLLNTNTIPTYCFFFAIRLCSGRQNTSLNRKT